jgi:Mg2+/citrate symporter
VHLEQSYFTSNCAINILGIIVSIQIQFEMEKSEKEKLKTHSLRTKEELQNYEREMEAMVTKKVRATRSIFHNVVAHVQGY